MVLEGWKVKSLGEISRVTSGGTPSKENPAFWNGRIPWIRTTEVQNCQIYSSDIQEFITEEGLKSSSAKLLPKETILLAMIGQGKTRGQVAITKIEASTNQNCAAIILHKDQVADFHFYSLLNQYEKIRGLSNSAGQGSLSGAIIKTIKVLVPPLAEQNKIARILSTWNQAIATAEQLLANSQQQKKALMQQLLSGKKRLPGFSEPWINCAIGKLLKEVKRPVIWDDNSYYRLLSVKRRSEGVILREVLPGSEILTKKMNQVKSGDFIISKMQIVHGAMGLVKPEHHDCHISDSYICLVPKSREILDTHFFSWFFMQKIIYHKAFLCSHGVHIEKMSFDFQEFLKEKIVIPACVDEQKAIAAVLASADREIETLQQQLADLKQEKKALMQQLLTGKRRVKIDET